MTLVVISQTLTFVWTEKLILAKIDVQVDMIWVVVVSIFILNE